MGFRELFKVRKPGNGSAFEKSVAAASSRAKAIKVSSHNNSANSGGKRGVSSK